MNRKNICCCRSWRSLLHAIGIENVMAGQRVLAAAVLIILIMVLCCACSGNSETKGSRQQRIESYCQAIGEDADAYFTELSESACGIRPERIYYSISEDTSDEVLSKEPLTWQEMLEKGTPGLVAGLHKKPEARTDGDYYSEQEIRQVLNEAVNRGIIVNIYFDNEHLIYKIEQGGKITVEETEGADGGAYRNVYEYRLEE